MEPARADAEQLVETSKGFARRFQKILNGARMASTTSFAFRARGEKEERRVPRS